MLVELKSFSRLLISMKEKPVMTRGVRMLWHKVMRILRLKSMTPWSSLRTTMTRYTSTIRSWEMVSIRKPASVVMILGDALPVLVLECSLVPPLTWDTYFEAAAESGTCPPPATPTDWNWNQMD